jgi:aspartyl-tRNA(Asn)/glutamyl-tRNA(Gln) amidotransferase subunit A
MNLTDLTACQWRDALREGRTSSREATDACLAAIERLNPTLRAFLSVDADGARRRADEVDRRRAAREPLGLLAGIPVAVKDNMCTADGQPTTCASRILGSWRAPYDAHVVERLRAEGAVIVGKTNLDEFAMGSSTENSAFGTTRNPWDTERVPGGSSGGSAAAVAARMVPFALGSDTGGSIRQPAALCGVVGLKPTYGRVSRYGLVAFASSLDQIGPFGRTVADAALLLQATAGHDPRDSTSVSEKDQPVPDYLAALDEPVLPLRIGVPREFFGAGLDPEVEAVVRAALAVYERLGARLVEVSLPHSTEFAIATYYIVATSEASSNLARYDGVHYGRRSSDHADMIDMYMRSRAQGFGDEVKRRIMLGTYALSAGYYDAYYKKALRVRRLIRRDFEEAFRRVDCIMGPTSPTAAFRIGERAADPLAMYLSDVYTVSANLAAIPGASLPCGFTRAGLPVGLQILSDVFTEDRLLRIARMYERETDWSGRAPPLAAGPTARRGGAA